MGLQASAVQMLALTFKNKIQTRFKGWILLHLQAGKGGPD
jgi:hypothetical protein